MQEYTYFFFLNIDFGYSLEAPRRGGSNVNPVYVLSKIVKKISFFFSMEFSIFAFDKNLCILHGNVSVMKYR